MTDPRQRASAVAVVVLSWNGWTHTQRCLLALAQCRGPVDVIVVDNGSTDGTVGYLKAWSDRSVQTVLLPRNTGFTGGMNAGLTRVFEEGHEYVWLLNNDVTFARDVPDGLRRALDRGAGEAVLSPVLTGPGGRPQHIGGRWRRDGSANELLTPDAFNATTGDDQWLTGTALFCRTATARRIGLFDRRLFAYWDDVDWSIRATALGIRLEVASDCLVTHDASQGLGSLRSPVAAHLIARNELRLVRKHLKGRRRRQAMARVVARAMRLALVLERGGNPHVARALLGGLAAGIMGMGGQPRLLAVPRLAAAMIFKRPLTVARSLEQWADRR